MCIRDRLLPRDFFIYIVAFFLFKIIILLHLLFKDLFTPASKCWQVTKKNKENLGAAEMDCLRKPCRI